MNNYKTSITGIMTAIAGILVYYNIIPKEIGVYIIALGVAVFSLVSKDYDVTGIANFAPKHSSLTLLEAQVKPKNRFWKFIAKAGIFAISLVLKNQKGVNSDDVEKGVEIANKSIE